MFLLLLSSAAWSRTHRDSLGVGPRMLFSENKGQWENPVLFKSDLRVATLFLERDCFTLLLVHPDCWSQHPRPTRFKSYRTHAYKVHFVGSKVDKVMGEEREDTYENYYLGNDPSRWCSGVGVYGSVYYDQLWRGIDMRVYSAQGAMKYDFLVAPGADVSQIALRYEGVDGIRIKEGNLRIKTSVMEVVELAPYAYQIKGDDTIEVAARYVLQDREVRLSLGSYDSSLPLVIDPYLYFSTYTGSTADNWGTTSAYDSYKNTYTSGLVFGDGYPTSVGSYDGTYNGNADIGIFKFDTNGTHRLYATYLGGGNADMPHSMFVNAFDELVVFGTTGSSNFPTTEGAYDRVFSGGNALQYEGSSTINFPNGSDIFLCRFNADGSQLQASTYVGGSGNDGMNYETWFTSYDLIMLGNDSLYYNYGDGARGELMIDDLNNVYVGSTTRSTDFPTTSGAIQPYANGGREGVVFKIDYNLHNMMWCTYLGGVGNDAVYSVDVDTSYNVVVCGGTTSGALFPTTPNSYKPNFSGGSADGFVAKISRNGTTLMASTFFGSSAYDQCYFVRVGKQNDVFIFGQTTAPDSTLIYNAAYNTPNSGQFLARLKPNLDTLKWSTVFGTGSGEPNLSPTAFAVDICNRIYLAGWGRKFCGYYLQGATIPWNTYGTAGMQVTADAYQNTTDGQDFYVMTMDTSANALIYASFFGEQHSESVYGGQDHVDGGTSRFDRLGTLYESVCASCGGYQSFPTTSGAWSNSNNASNCNNALFRLNLSSDFPVAEFVPPSAGCAPLTIEFHNTGRGESYQWDFGDGSDTSAAVNPTHTFSNPGNYTIRLVARMAEGCRTTDTMYHTLRVLGDTSYWIDTIDFCPADQPQIGLHPQMGCSYQWIEGEVSDSTVANPYVTEGGVYTLLVTTDNCVDTIHQMVRIGTTAFTLAGDTSGCTSPINLSATFGPDIDHVIWSHSSSLSDTINSGNLLAGSLRLDLTQSCWIYLYVEDRLGCRGLDSLHIQFYNIMDTLIIKSVSCPGDCNGSVIALPSSYAVAPYGYECDGQMLADSLADGLCPGNHTYIFSDANGCSIERTFPIADAAVPNIQTQITHVLCHEYATGAINISIGDTGSYTFYWYDDESTTSSRTGLNPGTYICRITSPNGCIYYDTAIVIENADMQVSTTHIDNTCHDYCSGSALATAAGGTAPYTYEWSNGETTAQADALCEGMVTVWVTDATGCRVHDSVAIATVSSYDSIEVWANDDTVYSDQITAVHATSIPGATYSWQPPQLLANPYSSNSVTVPLQETTTFICTVVDSIGCEHIDSVKVVCNVINCGEPNIFIPNTFTPNGDGVNDRLCVTGEDIVGYHLCIFSRWGELVFETNNLDDCWDGTYKGKPCMAGVYVYHCDIYCTANHEASLKGDITLIR